MFSVIGLDGYINFFTGIFLQVLYLPSPTGAKTENLEEGFLWSFFINFAHSVIGSYELVSLQISCRKLDLIEEIDRGL